MNGERDERGKGEEGGFVLDSDGRRQMERKNGGEMLMRVDYVRATTEVIK